TRCYRDWSSDVCSSDLLRLLEQLLPEERQLLRRVRLVEGDRVRERPDRDAHPRGQVGVEVVLELEQQHRRLGAAPELALRRNVRSEERREGKACRGRWG